MRCQLSPFAGRKIEANIHDAHPLESEDLIAQVLAHPADLAVESLGKHDPEAMVIYAFDLTLARDRAHNWYTGRHAFDKRVGDGFVDAHDVFLFMVVARPQDLIDDVAVAGQQDEAFAGFVEAPDGENAFRIVDEINDIVLFPRSIRGANNSYRLVESEVNMLPARFGDGLPVYADFVVFRDLRTHLRDFPVNGHAVLLDQLIGFPARAKADLAQVLVDAGCFFFHRDAKIRIK